MTTQMLLDLLFLSDCDMFVGSQRSMYGWVATRLMIGKGNEKVWGRGPRRGQIVLPILASGNLLADYLFLFSFFVGMSSVGGR